MQKLEGVLSKKEIVRLAKECGFSKLERQSLTPEMFLKMVLFDHLVSDQPSLQQHSYSILEESGVRISKQGIDKRFTEKAVVLVKGIFEKYFRQELWYKSLPSHLRELFTSVLIMDSTEFKLPESLREAFPGFQGDGTASCAQIQFEYDVLSGGVRELSVEKGTVSDKAYAGERLDSIPAGALLLRDMAYYSLDMYKEIADRQAWYISRLKSQILIYEQKGNGYEELTYGDTIKRIKRNGGGYLDMEVFLSKEKKYRVRLIAGLLDEASAAKRGKRKKHRKGRH